MLRNYLKVAFRNLAKNKVFSTINILGLALGMACSILILLWIHNEKSVNGQHKNASRIYTVYERQYNEGQVHAGFSTPGVLAPELKKVIPEIELSAHFAWEEQMTFQFGDKILKKTGNYAGPDYFKMFTYTLLEGNAENALNSPLGISISRKMAVDFFGSPQAAIGKTIRMEDRKDLKVTAVFETLTDLNSDQFDFLLSWDTFLEGNEWAKDWTNNGPRTNIMLRADADPVKVEAKIRKFLDNYNKDQTATVYIELGMQRYDQVYLYSNFKNGQISGGRIEYVRLFAIIAIFILVIACINFMNLTTARSIKRSKEIGIRKVAGAVRFILVKQFIGEAILIASLALVIAILLVTLLLPLFNNITGKHITLPFNEPAFWAVATGLTIVTGFISGSYPALFLSAFQPIRVLKGSMKFSAGATWLRKGLVVFQFILSIILIVGTLVVSRQINYIQTINLGYDRENLVWVPIEGELKQKYKLYKDEALRLPGIKSVTKITQVPTDISNSTSGVGWEGKDPNTQPEFTHVGAGYDFIKTMNLKLRDGRDLSKNFASDSAGYIVNEAALKIINYKDPVGKSLTFWQKKGTIIGVLKDFHFKSLHEPISPLVVRLEESADYGSILIRIEAGKTKQVLAGLEGLNKKLNPKFPFSYSFADEEYSKLYKSEEVVGNLSNSFAILAIFISCLGLLGLAMFTAEQRTKEFGIRKVLGASSKTLFALLSKDFLVLVFIAFVIASPLAWLAMNKWLLDFEYRININWEVFAVAGFAALLITLFTVSFQAIKAAVANPVTSLRTE